MMTTARYSTIPSTLFADRRNQFSRRMPRGTMAIFFSNPRMRRTADQFYPFRQNSALFALSGLEQENTILILYPDAPNPSFREVAFILPQDTHHKIWNGDRYTPLAARRISGIDTIKSTNLWTKVIRDLAGTARSIMVNCPWPDDENGQVQKVVYQELEWLKQHCPQLSITSVYPILESMMMIKHPLELDLMRRAIDITGLAFDRLLRALHPGMKEFEAEAELTFIFTQHGCSHAFEPIIASGKSACTLHYTRNNGVIGKDELVLIDFGAAYANMNADVTRTLPASGKFTARQRAVYNAVHHILMNITEMMRPGITLKELNAETGKLVEKALIDLKCISRHDLRHQDKNRPIYRNYFMHGVSHHLGYDVHDIGDRNAPLRPGMVLTCEPGIYIPKEKIGIRLENDILITRGKPRNLTAQIPIEAAEIEEIMNSI